jgi:hypothetical protein
VKFNLELDGFSENAIRTQANDARQTDNECNQNNHPVDGNKMHMEKFKSTYAFEGGNFSHNEMLKDNSK